MKKITTIIAVLGLCLSINAQDLNTHYLYQMNWYNINPAYTGDTEGVKTMINPGTQWAGLDGNPTNSMFGLHTKVKKNMGLGSKFVIDKRGLFTNMTAELTYSYTANLTDEHKITFGVSAGIFQTYLDKNSVLNDRYTDVTDPTLTTGYYNKSALLTSFGVLYKFKELEIGASAPHLVVSGRPISDHIFGVAKYNFLLSDDKIKLTPSLVYQNLTKSPNQLDIGVKGEWNNLVWGQVTYRTNKTIVTAIGVDINKINFGYAYVINQNPLSVISSGSHEVYIGFTFDKKAKPEKKSRGTIAGPNNEPNYGGQPSQFQTILNDLRTISEKDNTPKEVQAEISKIQEELTTLILKAKNGSFSKEDEQRIHELEGNINKLKSKLGY